MPTLVPRPRSNDDRDHMVVPLARAPNPDGPRHTGTSTLTQRTFDRRWIVVSVAAHVVVIGALVFGLLEALQPPPPPVLQITLIPQTRGSEGVSGGASATAATASTDASASATALSQPDIPAPPPEPVSPPAQPEMPPPTPPQPEIPKPTPPTPEIPPPTPSPTKAIAPAPPQLVMDIPPPKPRYVPPRHQMRRTETPPRPPAAPVPARPNTPAPQPAPAAAQTKTALASPGTAAGPGQGTEGAGKGAIGNTAGPGDDYLEKLYRHLLRFKKYPPEAIGAKQQGRVEVGFTIARDGTISGARIEKSSGSAMLDQATLALVQHASPAPPLPDSYKGSAARVKFPIDYKLSLIDQMF